MTQPAPETGGQQGTTPPAQGSATPPPEGQQPPAPPEGQQQGSQQQTPPPAETVEFWKQKSREQEARAKANAEAAKELEKIKEGQKTEQQKQQEAAEQAAREAAEARAETARWKAAAANRVSEENFDLLGTGTEEEINSRAKRVGTLEAAAAELAEIKKQQGEQPPPTPPSGAVKGLTPGAPQQADSSYPADWFPQLKNKKAEQTKGI